MDATVRRRSGRRGAGWVATLAGAALLLGAGFGVGLMAGTAFEEPDLVWEHLAGRTQEVPLAGAEAALPAIAEPAPEPPPALAAPTPRERPLGASRAPGADPVSPPVATAPPPTPPAAAARPVAAPAPAPPRAPAPASAAPAASGFAVQVGAFGERTGAERLVASLRTKGFPASVARETGGAAPFKVRVGPVSSRPEAERLAGRLKREERLPTWVLTLDGR